jgi:cytochrome c oxidase subunit 3
MAHSSNKYYVPESTRWPVITSVGLFIMFGGAAILLNGGEIGQYAMYIGLAIVIWMMFTWFGEVISESEGGIFNDQVDGSFRMGMFWFIFSEVMFFACFFGALWYARNLSLPWLAGEGNNFLTNQLLWDSFEKSWPSNGPGNIGGTFEPMAAMGIPAINTAILLSSGVTLTIAHHALKEGKRSILNIFLALTFILGFIFIGLQAEEYIEAYQHLNLTLERLSRFTCDDRCDDAPRHLAALPERSFHTEKTLRVRECRVVLALCRRCLAWPVYFCLLVVGKKWCQTPFSHNQSKFE